MRRSRSRSGKIAHKVLIIPELAGHIMEYVPETKNLNSDQKKWLVKFLKSKQNTKPFKWVNPLFNNVKLRRKIFLTEKDIINIQKNNVSIDIIEPQSYNRITKLNQKYYLLKETKHWFVKIEKLKKLCKKYNLKSSGSKMTLVKRLKIFAKKKSWKIMNQVYKEPYIFGEFDYDSDDEIIHSRYDLYVKANKDLYKFLRQFKF